MRNPFKITQIDSADSKDDRGSTREWKLSKKIQITVYTRKKGSTSRHYHKGEDKSKNPERLFLIKGKMKIIFEVNGVTEERILTAGTELTIYPPTKHEVVILEDATFIEYRVTHFDSEQPDTYSY